MRKSSAAYALVLGALALSAGAGLAQQARQTVSDQPLLTRFDSHDDALWWRADDRLGGKKINDTGFAGKNIAVEDGAMVLTLTGEPYRDRGHTGAAYKSRNLHAYGRFDAVMKAARGSGLISAFYTYTGPAYGDPHDEIDFEFLGRDPHFVHLNYFVGGTAKLKRTVDVGFDVSEDFHLYTIEWRPGEIIWRIDGEELFRASGAPSEMPQHPGKIIADIWAAKGLIKWAGAPDPSALPAKAFVRCISFRPPESAAPTCAESETPGDEERGSR